MQNKKNHTKSFLIIGFITLILFAILSFGVQTDQPWMNSIDDAGRQTFQATTTNGLTDLIIAATEIGNIKLIIGLTIAFVIFLFFKKRYADGLWFGGTILFGAAIATKIMKELFGRERPQFNQLIEKTTESFPSGHATGTTVFYGLIAVIAIIFIQRLGRRWLVAGVALLIIAFVLVSRVYLGVHYPTDVIGGLLFGTATVNISVGTYIIIQNKLVHSLRRLKLEDRSVLLAARQR